MDKISRFLRACRSPTLFGRGLNRLYYSFNPTPDAVDIFEEDWDNLLLLDGCRYDMFASTNELSGQLEHRMSRASATVEFLEENFTKRDLRDTVYVTANPQLYRYSDIIDTSLFDVINVWLDRGWNEKEGTVLPETMVDAALAAAKEYPNKRLLVHFMQPHYPFIGSGTEFDKHHLTQDNAQGENVWGKIMTGKIDISRERIWQIYVENLKIALESIEELLRELSGLTVVTADHGNMVGERAFPIPIREWGHPRGIYTEELVKVPWLVHLNGERREINSGEPERQRVEADDDLVAERLRNLGYAE
jgi:hypothetical protein